MTARYLYELQVAIYPLVIMMCCIASQVGVKNSGQRQHGARNEWCKTNSSLWSHKYISLQKVIVHSGKCTEQILKLKVYLGQALIAEE